MPAAPFLHRHGGPLPRCGHDVEVVHQAAGARQPEPQPAGRRVAVLQGGIEEAERLLGYKVLPLEEVTPKA